MGIAAQSCHHPVLDRPLQSMKRDASGSKDRVGHNPTREIAILRRQSALSSPATWEESLPLGWVCPQIWSTIGKGSPRLHTRKRNPLRDQHFTQFFERDRLDRVGVFATAASVAGSDFDAGRMLRLRAGFGSDFGSASIKTGAGIITDWATRAFGLRPKPTALAIVERCSE